MNSIATRRLCEWKQTDSHMFVFLLYIRNCLTSFVCSSQQIKVGQKKFNFYLFGYIYETNILI